MARCRLSDRKVRRKIRPRIPCEYTVAGAMVRGGQPHNIFLVCMIDSQQRRECATLDIDTGELEFWGQSWGFVDESKLAESIAYINAPQYRPA